MKYLLLFLILPTALFASHKLDNIVIDGNTILSADTNGDINLDPNGSGGVAFSDLTATTVPYLDANKEITSSSVTPTELGYLSSVTSAIQTQLNAKIDDFSGSTDNVIVRTDGASGDAVQESGVSINDSDVVSGITQLNVDNLRLDGNTISSTDTNGDVVIAPDGSGFLTVAYPTRFGDGDGDVSHTLNGTSIDSSVEVHESGGSDLGGLSVHRHVDSATLGAHYLGLKSRGSHASPTVVQSGDVISRFAAYGYDGTDYAASSEIRQLVDATPGSNDMPGRISFLTSADGAQSPTEAVRIDSGQDVNIMSQNELRFQDSSGGEYMGFKAPSSVTSSTTFTLPNGDGSNGQQLTTNGSGTLSWAAAGSGGSSNLSVVTKTTTYTITTSDDVVLADASSAAFTLTLPTASGNDGEVFYIKKIDSDNTNAVTIDGNGSETIDGSNTYVIYGQYGGVIVASNGTNYDVLGAVKERKRIQTKYVAADTTDGDLSELTFSNLIVGKWYEVTGSIIIVTDSGASAAGVIVHAIHDSSNVYYVPNVIVESTDSNADTIGHGVSFKFKATATTLTWSVGSASANDFVLGNGTTAESYIQIEERNDLIETSSF